MRDLRDDELQIATALLEFDSGQTGFKYLSYKQIAKAVYPDRIGRQRRAVGGLTTRVRSEHKQIAEILATASLRKPQRYPASLREFFDLLYQQPSFKDLTVEDIAKMATRPDLQQPQPVEQRLAKKEGRLKGTDKKQGLQRREPEVRVVELTEIEYNYIRDLLALTPDGKDYLYPTVMEVAVKYAKEKFRGVIDPTKQAQVRRTAGASIYTTIHCFLRKYHKFSIYPDLTNKPRMKSIVELIKLQPLYANLEPQQLEAVLRRKLDIKDLKRIQLNKETLDYYQRHPKPVEQIGDSLNLSPDELHLTQMLLAVNREGNSFVYQGAGDLTETYLGKNCPAEFVGNPRQRGEWLKSQVSQTRILLGNIRSKLSIALRAANPDQFQPRLADAVKEIRSNPYFKDATVEDLIAALRREIDFEELQARIAAKRDQGLNLETPLVQKGEAAINSL